MICQSRIWCRTGSCSISRREIFTGETCIGADELARLCAKLAENKKAEEIVVLDLRGISSFTDYFVICSANSEPHLKAINNGIREGIREHAQTSPLASEGSVASQWLVMDYSDVLVHIFLQKKREFYALESLWSDAPRLNLVS
ncbi:MAG: ribosome silencing factor [Verrucomicrobia bacterium]|nr:ribosome silencing factor [Verrucomicrobiota bacterium]MBV8376790.1 ribosome silencing factor [Verrucomicrobiota bacterium]